MLGEKVFLFVWALVSQTKDVLIDYTTDVLEYITATSKPRNHRKKKPQQISIQDRRRRAYFRRLRHQMGVYTPDKDKNEKSNQGELNGGDELDNIAANLQEALAENDDKQSKLEDLESQLMELKQQLAMMNGKPSPQKQQSAPKVAPPPPHTPSMLNNHVSIAASINSKQPVTTMAPPPPPSGNVPPPPPPPPMPLQLQKPVQQPNPLSASVPSINTTKRMERSMSLADIVRSAKDHKLRPTSDISRSPHGTPSKRKGNSGGFQSELFAAIQNKFKNMNEDDDDDNNTPKKNSSPANDSDDDDSDNFDTPPKRSLRAKEKENPSPMGKRAASPIHSRPTKPLHTVNK